jgi:hypothetical protein
MSTTFLKYSLQDFDNIAHSGGMEYTLAPSVLAVLDVLCKEIGYDPLTTPNTYVNHYNAQRIQNTDSHGHNHSHSHSHSYNKNKSRASRHHDDQWKSSHIFKTATIDKVDANSLQGLLNETRTSMNKMTNANRDSQIDHILAKILDIRCCASSQEELDANVDKAFSLIYTVCQGNRTYSENYALLWKQLKKHYPADVDEFLSKQWITYKQSFANIIDVSSDNYDLYCESVAKNDKRINQTYLFSHLVKKDVFSVDKLFGFLGTELVLDLMDRGGELDDKLNTKKIEEYVENLIIAIGILEQEFARIDDYEDELLPTIEEIVSSKRVGLSNRAKFKLMDITN